MNAAHELEDYYRAGKWLLQTGRRQQALVMAGAIRNIDPAHSLAMKLLRDIFPEKHRAPASPLLRLVSRAPKA